MSRLPKKPVWSYRRAYEEEVRQLIKQCHARQRAAQLAQVSLTVVAIFFLFSVVFNIFK